MSPFEGLSGAITRLRADGNIDTSFGVEGTVDIPLTQVAVLRDGKILVLYSDSASGSETRPMLTRLLPDGRIDRSFGGRGTIQVDLGGRHQEATALTTFPSGRIVVGGIAGSRLDARTGTIFGADVAMRLLPGGAVDRGFGSAGRAPLPVSAAHLEAAPGGYLVVASFASIFTRLRPGGAVDRSFGENGISFLNPLDPDWEETFLLGSNGIDVLSDGRIVAAGTVLTSVQRGSRFWAGAMRLRRNGQVDEAYGEGGVARLGFSNLTFGNAVAARSDGRVVVLGSTVDEPGVSSRLAAMSLLPSGRLDPRFGRAGKVGIALGEWVEGVDVLLRSGQVVLVGKVRGDGTGIARVPLVRNHARR